MSIFWLTPPIVAAGSPYRFGPSLRTELYVERTDLEQLLGRPVTSLASAVRAAL